MKFMKWIFLLAVILFPGQWLHSQQNIKPSCRNFMARMPVRVPDKGSMDRMNSMAFRSDTFDITHVAIHLEDVDYGLRSIRGFCDISFHPRMENQQAIHLDLLNLPVDSVTMAGNPLTYVYDSLMVHVYFDEMLTPDSTLTIRVYYGGHPTIDPSGFGGFDFQDGYAYNLGIGLASIPHNYGRGWFPCFDNFVERATYDFFVTTLTTQKAYCVGTHVSTDSISPGRHRFHFSMKQPITTYQAAVAIADYAISRSIHPGSEKIIPIELVAKPQDTTKFKHSFEFLPEAIDALEYWYGPYQWERVGYVITTRGAMEHPTCVAYPASLGLNENPYNNMDIMSHELAHHWFGNVTTLTTAYDMWIKEGTSEYGYHLFTREFLGEEEFYQLIAENQFDVIENAHRADDGFRALSGMPMEYTYGTTTYQKGAAVIHNLNSYLGDSLFRVGMQGVLSDFAFGDCDAADFEASVSAWTGKDMSDFFKDWIYAPGFSAFEIDSVHILPEGNQFDIELYIEQKLYHSPHFHTRVPMTVSFFDENWNKHNYLIELDGPHSVVQLSLDFKPVFQYLNDNNFLNNGQLSYDQVVHEDGSYDFKRSKLDVDIDGLVDSMVLFVEHIYGAPDPIKRTDLNIVQSGTHYWNIGGLNPHPESTRLSTRFYYEGNHEDYLDFDLTGDSEAEIILLYRPDAGTEWVEYPYAVKNSFIPTDGKGFFRVDSLLFGQYCFGNGDYFAVGTEKIPHQNDFTIHPNPAKDQVTVRLQKVQAGTRLTVLNNLGRQVKTVFPVSETHTFYCGDLPSGTYFIQWTDPAGKMGKTKKLIRM